MSTLLGPSLPAPVWKSSTRHWFSIALAGIFLLAAFFDTLRFVVANWAIVEEYSYGFFIPPIVAFLVWQKSELLRQRPLQGAWSGLLLVALGLLLLGLGEISAVRLFAQYGFVVAVYGVAACAIGWQGTRIIAVPLAMLVFMIPLPQFVLRELSQSLQLVSSQLGVALIRAADISVFLEGNVIDLGSYKLQVVEACSGLRYLFPLLVLGVLASCFFQGPLWQRCLIVLSTLPLTIVINSLRIGVIGISVELWGPAMAEGLLHDFEGGFMFLICMALLVAEMALLARFGGRRGSLRSTFGLDMPAALPRGAAVTYRLSAHPALAAAGVLALVWSINMLAPPRSQTAPERTSFAALPLALEGGWQGRNDHLDAEVLAILALQDYALIDYRRAGEPPVNFYAAYYASQAGGESSHSPRTCMPGGGWKISQITSVSVVPGDGVHTLAAVPVNRALIDKGDQRQLVYYWFRQRGHVLTDELQVKWLILHDGIVRHRSDGALLRLVTPVAASEDIAHADARLADLMYRLEPRLSAHVPD